VEPTTITQQAQGLALVLAAAHRMGLPEPLSVGLYEGEAVRLQLYGMDAFDPETEVARHMDGACFGAGVRA
jgi:septal ring factor EnvC (AmiA/AmiB activator)